MKKRKLWIYLYIAIIVSVLLSYFIGKYNSPCESRESTKQIKVGYDKIICLSSGDNYECKLEGVLLSTNKSIMFEIMKGRI